MSLRRNAERCVGVFLSLILLLMTVSCGTIEENTGDHDMVFSKMTQEQKKDYVQDYLKNAYGLNSEIVNDIKKREINSFSSEEQYYAIAKLEDNKRVYCWVGDDGQILDSYFVLKMEKDIEKVFEDIVSDSISNFKISCITTLNHPTDQSYPSDSVVSMLRTEDVTTSVRVFLDSSDRPVADQAISNRFDGKLDFTNGCLYVYYVDNLNEFDIGSADLTGFDASFEFKKG